MTFLRRPLAAALVLPLLVSAQVLGGSAARAETYDATPKGTTSVASILVDNGPRTLHLTATRKANGSGVLAYLWEINVNSSKKAEFTVYAYPSSTDADLYDVNFDHVSCKALTTSKKHGALTVDVPKKCLGPDVAKLQVKLSSTYQKRAGHGDCQTEHVPAHGYTPFLTEAKDQRVALDRSARTVASARRGC